MLKNTDVSDLNQAEENIKEALTLFEEGNFNIEVNFKPVYDKKQGRRVILDCLTSLAFINLEWHEW